MIKSFQEINEIASKISEDIKNGKITTLALIGDLGTGKTHLTKIICKNLGIKGNIKSPTFNYVNTYEIDDMVLSHFDVYRIVDESEIYDIGYEDYLDGRILIIEWADKISNLLPSDTLYLELYYTGETTRDIKIYRKNSEGDKEYENLCDFN